GAVIPEGEIENEVRFEIMDAIKETEKLMMEVKLTESLARIMKLVAFANRYFNKKEVWRVVKEDQKSAGNILFNCIQLINALRLLLAPFIPNASAKISKM